MVVRIGPAVAYSTFVKPALFPCCLILPFEILAFSSLPFYFVVSSLQLQKMHTPLGLVKFRFPKGSFENP